MTNEDGKYIGKTAKEIARRRLFVMDRRLIVQLLLEKMTPAEIDQLSGIKPPEEAQGETCH